MSGLITESDPVKPGIMISNPFMTEPSNAAGVKDCRVDDPYILRDRVEGLEIDGKLFQHQFDHEARGKGPDIGKSKRNSNLKVGDFIMNVSIGKMADDGSCDFVLSIGSGIQMESEPSSYLVKIE
ncbi:MAG: hypothetical protein ACI93G_001712 [Hyphomonas sp.]|jgi:hypothetical protein